MTEYKKVTKTEKTHIPGGYIKISTTEKIENKPQVGTPRLGDDYKAVFENLRGESLRELGLQPQRRR